MDVRNNSETSARQQRRRVPAAAQQAGPTAAVMNAGGPAPLGCSGTGRSTGSAAALPSLREDVLRQHQQMLGTRGASVQELNGEAPTTSSLHGGGGGGYGATPYRPAGAEVQSQHSTHTVGRTGNLPRGSTTAAGAHTDRSALSEGLPADPEVDPATALGLSNPLKPFTMEDLDVGRARGLLPGSWWVVPRVLLVGGFPMWSVDGEGEVDSLPSPTHNGGTGGKSSTAGTLSAALSDRDEALQLLVDVARVTTFVSLIEVPRAASNGVLYNYGRSTSSWAGTTNRPITALWLPLQAAVNYDDEYIAAYATDLLERILVRREVLYLHCVDGKRRAQAFAALLSAVLLNKNSTEAFGYVQRCALSSLMAATGSLGNRRRSDNKGGGATATATATTSDEDDGGDELLASLTSTNGEDWLGNSHSTVGTGYRTEKMHNVHPSTFSEAQLCKLACDLSVPQWRNQLIRLIDAKERHFSALVEQLYPPVSSPGSNQKEEEGNALGPDDNVDDETLDAVEADDEGQEV